MIALLIATIIILTLIYSTYKKKIGYILSLFLVFPYLLPTTLIEAGFIPHALLVRLSFFLVVLAISIDYKNKQFNLLNNPVGISYLALIFSIIYFNSTSDYNYNFEFSDFYISLLLYNFIPFFIGLYLTNSKERIKGFVFSISIWATLYIVFIITYTNFANINYLDRFSFVDETGFDTITTSRLSAIILISSLLMLKTKKLLLLTIPLLISSTFLLLITGQRGTLLGIIFCIAIYYIFSKYSTIKNIIYKISIITVIIALFTFIDLNKFEVFNRFSELKDYESFERYQDYFEVWEIFESNSFVFGEGSLGYYFLTGRVYPHNIVLEAIVDYGLLGFVSIVIMIIYGLIYSIKLIRFNEYDINNQVVAYIWIMLLISVLVSGSFVSNSIFFIFTGILVNCYKTSNIQKLNAE